MSHIHRTPGNRVHHAHGYSAAAFDIDKQRHIAFWASKIVQQQKADAIIACGHSGLVIAGAVGLLAHVPVFAVRKQGEKTVASSYMVTGISVDGPAKRWVWIDDFFARGSTIAYSAKQALAAGLIESAQPLCAVLYNEYDEEDRRAGYDVIDSIERETRQTVTAFPCYGFKKLS